MKILLNYLGLEPAYLGIQKEIKNLQVDYLVIQKNCLNQKNKKEEVASLCLEQQFPHLVSQLLNRLHFLVDR